MAPPPATDLIVEGLSCLRGERVLFDPLSFSLKPGEGLFVRGANGAGKSSLLKLLAGLLRPYTGQIALGGQGLAADAYRRNIAYLGHLDGLKPSETAGEALAFRARLFTSPSWERSDAQRPGEGVPQTPDSVAGSHPHPTLSHEGEGLATLNMHAYADTPIRYLSAGQRRRVALAGVLASGAPLWLLDEPTTALDADSSALVYQALRAHLAKGGMFVAATHDDPPAIVGAMVLGLGT